MAALPPAQAQVMAALSRGCRITLKHQTGRIQAACRALIARGVLALDDTGVVTRVDT